LGLHLTGFISALFRKPADNASSDGDGKNDPSGLGIAAGKAAETGWLGAA